MTEKNVYNIREHVKVQCCKWEIITSSWVGWEKGLSMLCLTAFELARCVIFFYFLLKAGVPQRTSFPVSGSKRAAPEAATSSPQQVKGRSFITSKFTHQLDGRWLGGRRRRWQRRMKGWVPERRSMGRDVRGCHMHECKPVCVSLWITFT